MSELMTVDELAAHLKLSKPTIYRLTSQKLIPHIKIGQRVLFDIEQINVWLREQSRGVAS